MTEEPLYKVVGWHSEAYRDAQYLSGLDGPVWDALHEPRTLEDLVRVLAHDPRVRSQGSYMLSFAYEAAVRETDVVVERAKPDKEYYREFYLGEDGDPEANIRVALLERTLATLRSMKSTGHIFGPRVPGPIRSTDRNNPLTAAEWRSQALAAGPWTANTAKPPRVWESFAQLGGRCPECGRKYRTDQKGRYRDWRYGEGTAADPDAARRILRNDIEDALSASRVRDARALLERAYTLLAA